MSSEKKQKKKKNNRLSNLIFALIFLIGLGILIYPMISAVYYDYESGTEVNDFKKEVELLSDKEIDARIERAKAYNESLSGNEVLHDAYSKEEEAAGKKQYAKMLEVREKMGHVEIPRIHQDLPLYAGTSERVLQEGLGHLENTSLPVGGESTHSVITGHRGLPDKKLFTDLDKMKVGDMIYVHNIQGVLAYKVDHIEVIEPNDFSPLKIDKGKDQLTLLTCTPYMINSHRLIVTGHRVPYTPEEAKKHEAAQEPWWYKFLNVYKNYLIGIAVALALYLLYRLWNKRRKKRSER